ncbi:MAG: hypothetical protein KF709_07640 [Gemmatimonadaceae bacterium]|nr:hypothetical protein [Gemmatimonadaceae bacterium]
MLGQLLLHRVVAYKTYTNMPGYDLVATNPAAGKSVKIQVKSRWSTTARGFAIRNLDCDFVVYVRLNRGNKQGTGVVKPPDYHVLPIRVIKRALSTDKVWGTRVMNRDVKNLDQYRERWDLIDAALGKAKKKRRGAGA